MSKVKIQGNATGTGIFTVAAPATNTDRTITLPDTSATLLAPDSTGSIQLDYAGSNNYLKFISSANYVGRNSSTGDIWLNAQGGQAVNLGINNTSQLKVDGNGRITMPSQPAFVVTKNGGPSGTLSSNTVLDFSYSILNRGGYYNTSTYTFTAPVAGYYMFYVHLYHQLSSGAYTRIMIKKNGSEIYQGTDVIPHAFVQTNSAGSGDYTSSTSIIYELAVNDYVNVAVRSGQTGQWYGGHSLFYGYLLG